MKSPSHDLTVFGATSFVGQILARYLFAQYGAHDGLKWALAGRSEQKLQRLRSSLGPKPTVRAARRSSFSVRAYRSIAWLACASE